MVPLILILLLLGFGSFLIHKSILVYNKKESAKREEKLEFAHNEAVVIIKSNIKSYSTLVSALKAFINNSKQFPTERKFVKFTTDLLKNSDFNNHIIVSYIDTNQIFRYSTTSESSIGSGLIGIDVKKFRSKDEIDILNAFMKEDKISLFPPINLVEGWAALPFNFSARNSENKIFGYIAPLVDLKYLLQGIYTTKNKNEVKHRFAINDSIDFNREEIYDGSKKYSTNKDPEYYKNFYGNDKFIYTYIDLYGQKLKVGTAFKEIEKDNSIIHKLTTIWYILLIFTILALVFQFYRFQKTEKELKKMKKRFKRHIN